MKNGKLYTCKALIIDDNETNIVVLANMLRVYLIDVDQAKSGSDALELLKYAEYDLIFVDHIMPDMDGVQTTRAIRSLNNNRKRVIFALTSSCRMK
jgi:CheY-like chemotaxis protein